MYIRNRKIRYKAEWFTGVPYKILIKNIGKQCTSHHITQTGNGPEIKHYKKEAETKGKLNPFDAILVSQISPGEIYGVLNSLQFAKDLVKGWLPKYKFRDWTITKDHHKPVTQEMKEKRASDISDKLCNHMDWHTHGRSLKMEDLKEELLIEDIDKDPELANVVYRIKTVIRLIFDTSTDFKLYFWEDCELARSANVANVPFNKL